MTGAPRRLALRPSTFRRAATRVHHRGLRGAALFAPARRFFPFGRVSGPIRRAGEGLLPKVLISARGTGRGLCFVGGAGNFFILARRDFSSAMGAAPGKVRARAPDTFFEGARGGRTWRRAANLSRRTG